jgi:SAM-dependent methyltransferase
MTGILKSVIPRSVRSWSRQRQRDLQHAFLPFRMVHDFNRLRTLTPVDRHFGWSRGTPIDRHYIEQFLSQHASDIRGRVLEFQSARYTVRFGGSRVSARDVLDLSPENPGATIIGDLTDATHIPSDTFDCVICTQVLHLIYDMNSAVRTLYRILKPAGVLLATVPGIAHKCLPDKDAVLQDYWRLTSRSARRLLEGAFPAANVEVKAWGNVLAAMAFLHGLATEEISEKEVDHFDPEFEVTIGMRARK